MAEPKIGDPVLYCGFEAVIEEIAAEVDPYQYKLAIGSRGVVIFTHPQHPGWGFVGSQADYEASTGRGKRARDWPSSFIAAIR